MEAASSNEFQLIVPEVNYGVIAEYGPEVTVPCHLSPAISAVDMEIRWFEGTDCVFLYKNREVIKGPCFNDTVNLFTQELEKGNVSLRLGPLSEYAANNPLMFERLLEGFIRVPLELQRLPLLLEKKYVCQVTSGYRTEELTITGSLSPLQDKFEICFQSVASLMGLDGATTLCASKSLGLEMLKEIIRTGKLDDFVSFKKVDCTWTEEQRTTMEESILMTEFKLKNKEELHKKVIWIYKEQNRKLQQNELQLQDCRMELERVLILLEMKESQLGSKNKELEMEQKTLKEMEGQLKELQTKLDNQAKHITAKEGVLLENEKLLNVKHKQIQEMQIQLLKTTTEVKETQKLLEKKFIQLENMNKTISEKERRLESTVKEMETIKQKLEMRQELQDKSSQEKKLLKSSANQETSISTAPARRRNSINSSICPNMSAETESHPESPVLVPGFRLVLLGWSGSEKRAAGNMILSREERIQTASSTEIQQSESRQGEVAGRKMTVVETPDWFCSGLSLEEVRPDARLCFSVSAPGPHTYLVVIPVKKYTEEERQILKKMEEMFWEELWRNTMILFIVTDEKQKRNIEKFIQAGNQELQRLVEKCGKRFHCLNINQSGDDSQVSQLLEKIKIKDMWRGEKALSVN